MLLAILMGQLYLLMGDAQPGNYKDIKKIISHKYKFIFVKIVKVVGISLELALREHLVGEYRHILIVAYDEKKIQ